MTCDVNSGFGSLAQFMLKDYIKDELPKAPVLLFALKNSNEQFFDKTKDNY